MSTAATIRARSFRTITERSRRAPSWRMRALWAVAAAEAMLVLALLLALHH